MCMYIFIFYVVPQSSMKTDIIYALCKKDKNMHRERSILVPNFIIFI
jgi:hypothetical protein